MRIGFCGYATAGKDEAAKALVEERGFVKVNMSDALQRDLRILNPLIQLNDGQIARLDYWLTKYSYDALKAVSDDYRTQLQRYGTDVWRTVNPDIWVSRAAEEASHHDKVVTTGIRYLNEIKGIDYLIRITRNGTGPLNDHTSEQLDPLYPYVTASLGNNGTVEELRAAVLDLYDRMIPVA